HHVTGEARAAAGAVGSELRADSRIAGDRPGELARRRWRRRRGQHGERVKLRRIPLRPLVITMPWPRRDIAVDSERHWRRALCGDSRGIDAEGGRDNRGERRRKGSRAHLADRDAFVRRDRGAVVVDPGEAERAALFDPYGELK